MPDFELYVSGDEAVLTLDSTHLASNTKLHVHNNPVNPTDKIYITFANSAAVNWQGVIDLIEGRAADLLIFLKSTTHIYNGSFKGFNSVLLTDHKISTENKKEILPNEEAHNNVKLIIDNFRAKEGYIFCNNLSLLKGGKVTDKLGIKLYGNNPQITFEGNTINDYLVLNNLDIKTAVTQLTLDKVVLNGNFNHAQINSLLVKDSVAADSWRLENIKSVTGLSLQTLGINNQIFTDSIEITNLLSPRGKFYISAKSYINFKIESQGNLSGIDLVLDMSSSLNPNKKIIFPAHKFRFDTVTIIKADEVTIPMGGSCKQLLLEDCAKVIVYNLEAGDVKYNSKSQPGKFQASGKILNNLLMIGEVEAILHKMDVTNLEGIGLCNVNFSSGVTCKMLQLNLNLDTANLNDQIQAGKSVIRIENNGQELTKIDTILAKLSTFYIKGNVELGNV
ncbi:hypothetical protein [Rickettsia endosymbiont of Orchestes rusci]|uniref:hypothetical protein n=1 Tax=Rickettsia endosymbiont of Orchestes rusci TaxID=3066250 RepID=UPI00313BD173